MNAVLLILAAVAVFASGDRSKYESVASRLAERPVTVTCSGPPLGEQYGSKVLLAPVVCKRLANTRRVVGGSVPTSLAILVFAHEIAHARGLVREMPAECWAATNFTRTARALGFTQLARLRSQLVAETFCPRRIK